MTNNFGFKQQREIDQALLGMSNPNNRQQQNSFSNLLSSPDASSYANQAIERMGLGSFLNTPANTPPSPSGGSYQPASDGSIRSQVPYDGNFNAAPSGGYYGQPQTQAFDGSFGSVSGQDASGQTFGFGGYGAQQSDLMRMAEQFGITPNRTVQQTGPSEYTGSMPSTYGIAQPSQFGFNPGAVEGGLRGFMEAQGMPSSPNLERLMNGQALQSADISRSVGALGNIPIPSLQSLARLAPSELEFLSGLFETVLGIPFMDILWQAQRPYQGLRGAPQGAFNFLGQ